MASFLIPVLAVLTLLPWISPALALVAGILCALTLENPYPTKNYVHRLLTWSVMGLGAGMNLEVVARVGLQGLGYTVVSIAAIMFMGLALQRLLKVEGEPALLITVGTAICGGSAIAAVTPVLKAKSHSVSVALGTVFILNALALMVFPPIGHWLQLSERDFGLWAALAIHDTSSVVGASVSYGPVAAEVGTTIKLARALWIVPLTLIIGFWKSRGSSGVAGQTKKPWFILGFLAAAALVTWVPELKEPGHLVEKVARRTLVLTLFLIGLGLSKDTLKQVGLRPFILGFSLWVIVSIGTVAAITTGLIH